MEQCTRKQIIYCIHIYIYIIIYDNIDFLLFRVWIAGKPETQNNYQNPCQIFPSILFWRWVLGFLQAKCSDGDARVSFMYEIGLRNVWSRAMMTSSNGNIFRVTGHLCGKFTGHRWIPAQRPVTRTFDVFFDLCLNKRLSKQSWSWWFETLSLPLWRHCNDKNIKYHFWHSSRSYS